VKLLIDPTKGVERAHIRHLDRLMGMPNPYDLRGKYYVLVEWAGNFARSHRGYVWRDPPRIDLDIPASLEDLSVDMRVPMEQLKTDIGYMERAGLIKWVPVPVPDLSKNTDTRGGRKAKKGDCPAQAPEEIPAQGQSAALRPDAQGAPVTRGTEQQRNNGTEEQKNRLTEKRINSETASPWPAEIPLDAFDPLGPGHNDPNGLNGLTDQTEELPTVEAAVLSGVPAGAVVVGFPANDPNRDNSQPIKAEYAITNSGDGQTDSFGPIDPTSFDQHLGGVSDPDLKVSAPPGAGFFQDKKPYIPRARHPPKPTMTHTEATMAGFLLRWGEEAILWAQPVCLALGAPCDIRTRSGRAELGSVAKYWTDVHSARMKPNATNIVLDKALQAARKIGGKKKKNCRNPMAVWTIASQNLLATYFYDD